MMIKLVSFEPAFSDRFSGIHRFHCGVVLGGAFGKEECLFLPVQLPRKIDAGDDYYPHSIQQIDGKWVASHCKNLQRMIPGGVRISGLCLMCTVAEFTSQQECVKRILMRLPKDDDLVQELGGVQVSELVVLLVDPQSKKFTCYTLDTNADHPSFGCIPVKCRELMPLWKSFKTSISLCLETSLPSDRKKEKILKQLQLAVEPYLSALLKDTQLLVNGEYRSPEQRVIFEEVDSATPTRVSTSKVSKKSSKASRRKTNEPSNIDQSGSEFEKSHGDTEKIIKKRSGTLSDMCAEKGSWADVELTIFGPQFPRWQRASSSSSLESGASSDTGFNGGSENADSVASDPVPTNRMVLNGKIPGIAFLPHNTTTQALLQALRKDLVQSIWARLQLLTEELHITSAELEVPRMLLPQRVLIRLPACPFLPLSDYKFLSETAEDVVTRLHYFCVPIGVRGDGDTGDSGLDSPSSSVESCLGFGGAANIDVSSLHRSIKSGKPNVFPLNEHIDASCLDTSLEKSPEGSVDDEISETELMDTVHQGNQPSDASWSSATIVMLISLIILITAIVLSFTLLGSRV